MVIQASEYVHVSITVALFFRFQCVLIIFCILCSTAVLFFTVYIDIVRVYYIRTKLSGSQDVSLLERLFPFSLLQKLMAVMLHILRMIMSQCLGHVFYMYI
jgi:hypothetical protein